MRSADDETTQRSADDEPTTLFGRVVAALVCGAAGALMHTTWNLFYMDAKFDPGSWGFRVCVIIGVVLGAVGGVPMMRWLWKEATEDFRDEVRTVLLFGLICAILFGVF